MVDAMQAACRETMEEIGAEMQAQVYKGLPRTTGAMLWYEATHYSARPEKLPGEKSAPRVADPHWHIHNLVPNVTMDCKKWKAAEFGEIVARMPYFQAAFDDRFASKLQALGYAVERAGLSFPSSKACTRRPSKSFPAAPAGHRSRSGKAHGVKNDKLKEQARRADLQQ